MSFTDDQLSTIYDRTSGRCHICRKQLAFRNYGQPGNRGAWEVEHSRPRAKGGTDRLNNLYAAHISCNRSKGTRTTRTARRQHGRTRAPLSVTKRKEAKRSNAIAGGVLGALVGSVAGPWGIALGAAALARVGYKMEPDD